MERNDERQRVLLHSKREPEYRFLYHLCLFVRVQSVRHSPKSLSERSDENYNSFDFFVKPNFNISGFSGIKKLKMASNKEIFVKD